MCCGNGAAMSYIRTSGGDKDWRECWDYGERLRLEGGKGGGVARSRLSGLDDFKMEGLRTSQDVEVRVGRGGEGGASSWFKEEILGRERGVNSAMSCLV